MKIRNLSIKNFKGIKELEIDFTDFGEVRPVTAILGDNGSGKTTVLQAIALVLSLATRKISKPEEFRWHGFELERISSLGPTEISLDVEFDESEEEATEKLHNVFMSHNDSIPDSKYIFTDSLSSQIIRISFSCKGHGYQGVGFFGRYYIAALHTKNPEVMKHLTEVGDVFWFDQLRSIGGANVPYANGNGKQPCESWQMGVEQLREYLVAMWSVHTSRSRKGRDYIAELEKRFQMVFPDVSFGGPDTRSGQMTGDMSDFFFYLERDGKPFDIAEMSSGEQAVFPLAYEFTRLDIAKSVVLIDELELHLHPPEQQALLGALRKLGPDCQFIITTHSPYLEGAIPDDHEYRLRGVGNLCL